MEGLLPRGLVAKVQRPGLVQTQPWPSWSALLYQKHMWSDSVDTCGQIESHGNTGGHFTNAQWAS